MSIQTYIQQHLFEPRLVKRGVLVVYDPDRRYREACLALAGEGCEVVDATESSILARERASKALVELGRNSLGGCNKFCVLSHDTDPRRGTWQDAPNRRLMMS